MSTADAADLLSGDADAYPNIPARVRDVAAEVWAAQQCCSIPMDVTVDRFAAIVRARPGTPTASAAAEAVADAGGCGSCALHGEDAPQQGWLPLEDTVRVWSAAGVDAARIADEVVVAESERHLGLIYHTIGKLRPRMPDAFEADDMKGYGWRGLQVALRQYDLRLGYRFSSFACPKISGAIRDGIRNESHLPKRLTTLQRKVDRAAGELSAALTRAPTFDEIADYLDLSADQRHYLPLLPPVKHLDDDPLLASQVLTSPEEWSPEHVVESEMMAEALSDALDGAMSELDPAAAGIVSELYLQGRTIKAVSADTGLSPRQVRQVRDTALATMRTSMSAWSG